VVARQIPDRETLATVHTQVRIALEQRRVVERRNVAVAGLQQNLVAALGRNNGIDVDVTAPASQGTDPAVHPVQAHSAAVGHLPEVVQPHRFLVIDPLQGHTRYIGAKDLMVQIVHPDLPIAELPLLSQIFRGL